MLIRDKNFPFERDLYGQKDITLENCTFEGAEDGESALKECRNITVKDCRFALRYPLWHDVGVKIINCVMTDTCRAPLWYSKDIEIKDSTIFGVKALRECSDISVTDTVVNSTEFGWKNTDITAQNCEITGEYPFFMSSGIYLKDTKLKGKYSFQYTENITVENCNFDTKDAFWHAKNVTVKNSVIKGEYFAWYSEGLTLINCEISGTQPLCYCKNLKLLDCVLKDADLAFEYSDVEATVKSDIISVKNVRSGSITAKKIGEIINTADSLYPQTCRITETNS